MTHDEKYSGYEAALRHMSDMIDKGEYKRLIERIAELEGERDAYKLMYENALAKERAEFINAICSL
jgi:hypothetical protein